MPYLRIQTNQSVDQAKAQNLIKQASKKVADGLGKPEQYVMVELNDKTPMMFAGSDDDLAYMELKSIGLPDSATKELSSSLCGLINDELGIEQNRVYIEFSDAQRHMWGWNGGTF